MLVAAVQISQLLAIVIGIVGLGGIIFTALRYNRDDTSAMVNTQNTIVGEMKLLNDELRTTTDRLRSERDEFATQVERLRVEIEALRVELRDHLKP